ncbi:hypothetical protein B0T16DRAFT_411765 [Cercophora newfieldiana]|uniref:Uncharacterized protein n=1 Tax=Cercophora newfieldiana TaxID=92897 RepID=A0AA40CQL9_9PEZI|nr:hypothetical protein B0T16DRAFT_411765 [Cercophora newfieldiana]
MAEKKRLTPPTKWKPKCTGNWDALSAAQNASKQPHRRHSARGREIHRQGQRAPRTRQRLGNKSTHPSPF